MEEIITYFEKIDGQPSNRKTHPDRASRLHSCITVRYTIMYGRLSHLLIIMNCACFTSGEDVRYKTERQLESRNCDTSSLNTANVWNLLDRADGLCRNFCKAESFAKGIAGG